VDDLANLQKRSRAAGRGGIQPGGPLNAGVYVGEQVYVRTWGKEGQEVRNRLHVHLYANGAYRVCDENDKQVEFGKGRYSYDPAPAKIEIGRTFELNNSSHEPNWDFCFLGRNAAGKPQLYGENDPKEPPELLINGDWWFRPGRD
jgi:hypothetical protein